MPIKREKIQVIRRKFVDPERGIIIRKRRRRKSKLIMNIKFEL